MSHLYSMLAGYWITHFDIKFVAQPPLPARETDSTKAAFYDRPDFTAFSPATSIAYLHFREDRTVQGAVWRNDGRNDLAFGNLQGTYELSVGGALVGIAQGSFELNFADFDVAFLMVIRNPSEFYFMHKKFTPKAGAVFPDKRIAPLTHGEFKRMTLFPRDLPDVFDPNDRPLDPRG